MNKLLVSGSVIAVLATGFGAQAAEDYITAMQSGDVWASDLVGARLNVADYEGDPQAYEDGGAEWSDVGEVNDVLLTRDGDVRAVVLDIGGFLGVGERRIAIPMDQLAFVRTGDEADDWRLVADRSRESLEQAPVFDSEAMVEAEAGERSLVDRMTDRASSAADEVAAAADASMNETFAPAKAADLTAESLTGARVYDASDEDIGEVHSLLVAASGEIDAAVIDVGGIIGVGEHQVRLPFEDLKVMTSKDGDEHRVHVDQTLESLKAMPAYEG